MTADRLLPINPYTRIHASPYTSGPQNKSELAQFSELMMSMMAGSNFLSSNTTTGGENFNGILMPLMLNLLEKIQSMQIDSSLESNQVSGRMPVTGGYISQDYHAGHNGMDFAVVEGTPVRATMSGNVVFSGWNDQGYGNLVIVENGARRSYYAHLSELPVEQGEWVRQGDVIGLSGNTGNSTGPHLHYEVRINGQNIDPSKE